MALANDSTSIAVYKADLTWLKRKQLEMSAALGTPLRMQDVLHAIIEALQSPEKSI